jgi:hypothetical protein
LADSEAIADGLNPLTINHIAITISCKNIGKFITRLDVEKSDCMPNKIKTPVIKCNIIAIIPQTDNHRGMSFD